MFVGANRCGRAWWICVPLVAVLTASAIVRAGLGFLPPEGIDMFLQAFRGLGFAVAAVWLLMPQLVGRNRIARFFGSLLAILPGTMIFGIAVNGSAADAGFFMSLLFVGGIAGLAFGLAVVWRKASRPPSSLLIWLPFWLLLLWLGILTPFFLVSLGLSGAGAEVFLTFLHGMLIFAVSSFLIFLPFLLLSLLEPFYRDRLRAFLGQGPTRETGLPPALATADLGTSDSKG